jgi:very-short-patch-repair endonuclease
MTQFYNRSVDKDKRRVLRNNPTVHEHLLWERLKGRQVNGLKFRRQYSVGPYIIDFYCPEVKLAVELDGSVHFVDDRPEYDANRSGFIERFGIRIVRITNDAIERDIEAVLAEITAATICYSERESIGLE